MIIAIDGPSGVGKSTISREIAMELGFSCLDTGAMFRTIALKAIEEGVDLYDDYLLGELAQTTDIAFEYDYGDPYPRRIFMDGEDVTNDIRTFEIDNAVTPVCQQPSVRVELLEKQRDIASCGNYVIDGRDIGTVVFPNAEVKIYLDATSEERAARRVAQNRSRGVGSTNYSEVLQDIERRDYEDMHREYAPLMQAEDAIYIDSTDMTQDEVIELICDIARGNV